MKCALVIPSWIPEEIFSQKTAGSQINYWQPLGTLYVAAAVKQAGHEVEFLNGAFMTNDEIFSALDQSRPDFVGLYSTTFGWNKACDAAQSIRKLLPATFIAVGGPYPIALKENCLEQCAAIDAVVTGEGEITVVELLDSLQNRQGLSGILGLAYRENDKIKTNPPRPLIDNLDSLPIPARELLGDGMQYIPPPATYKRKPVAVIMTARGCYNKCIYCFQIDKSRKSGVRFRSVENVMQEVELCLAQGYREIKFIDDTLAADYDRAMAIADEIVKRKLDFTWFASACVNQVDEPLLRAFKKAGCWAILLGAESGVQKNLNTIKKGTTPAMITKAVRAAKKAGITVYTPFLFGIPGQTFEEGLQSIEFACKLDPDIANFHAITPFPGTELYDNIDKYGTMSEELSDYTYQGAAFVPFTMTRDQISELRQIAFKRFYSRPGYLIKRFLKLRSMNDIRAALIGVKSLFWLTVQRNVFRKHR
ncbi:MAG: B12-binding domain-containing radical SAM protein [Proteobacteria bacterium]|nr:B12-binding domain-containing radical SAM protein [Pseudomonadota bacterium]MBU1708434.1 B12-binding domain-containing radical SAM protein [Pseudomonadota bacterium]